MTINEETFNLVHQQLQALRYDGPLGLSCDDTKLFAAWRMYWDGEKQAHFVVGGTGGPIRVSDPEKLKETLENENAVKAPKVGIKARSRL